ncbi:hypothetical protein A2U01_0082567, partial [Trifolium medium]|nr:hypothetical protein [Trifolium medium]
RGKSSRDPTNQEQIPIIKGQTIRRSCWSGARCLKNGSNIQSTNQSGACFSRFKCWAVRVKDSSTGAECTYHPMDGEEPSLTV